MPKRRRVDRPQPAPMETDTVPAAALPDDVLEDILGRLPARSLAASRLVCKAWRGLVDERRLLLPHLLPHSVRGLFVNYIDHHRPHFFARPMPPADGGPLIDGEFSFIVREKPYRWYNVLDHCNGLVLHSGDHFGDNVMYLCNPTTRRWARLPPLSDHRHWKRRAFVVFDPAVSPRWEVLLAPLEPHTEKSKEEIQPEERTMEWPPARWAWHVLSSTTMRWEEKVFVRKGGPAGTVSDLLLHSLPDSGNHARWRYSAYCQGQLYMHCRGEYVSRLSSSTNKYQVIKSPIDLAECHEGAQSFIGRSKNGVYFAAVDAEAQLRVWVLNESGHNKMEWLLKHRSVVNPDYEQMRLDGPWTIDAYNNNYGKSEDEEASHEDNDSETEEEEASQDDNDSETEGEEVSQDDSDSETEDDEEPRKDSMEWNSDEDDIIGLAKNNTYCSGMCVIILGFHPYKEVLYLTVMGLWGSRIIACHLNSTKVQYLGNLNPGCYNRCLYEAFVYTPCLIGL
ncbi:hypothetical protein BAE44_0000543 [Dichanthelium oligosanthes]|uniref:F-box domain-containing protein n=1 Tax=Dichanthelium oligosanthes TaxID=888268 RepID=A0A1E5WM47_9POAL|nr:hypothetical protein BAE44_0000543 [Dichanthelium oligosanthes]